MKITFVIGPPCAGKSTYIKENFNNITVLDIYNYQKDLEYITVKNVWESYEKLKNDIINEIKKEKDFVIEHTLLMSKRRKYYIDEIRKISDCDIDIILINPSIKEYKKRCKKREQQYSQINLELLEEPSLEEGFSNVLIIK